MMSQMLDIHADDYAISPNSDKTILDLCRAEKLGSISFIPNLSYAQTAAQSLQAIQKKRKSPVRVSVHINFVEGRCCAEKSLVPDLVDEQGFFTISWGKLFMWNYLPSRSRIHSQLKAEIIAQTEKLISLGIIDKNHIRFDSHQHTHMIPLVFDALMDAIKECGWGVDFIRNTEDPIHYYLGFPKLYASYSPINAIKCMILNFYALTKVRPALKKMKITPSLMCGVFFSGHMDKERLPKILPVFKKKAGKKNRTTEILFHPCRMHEDEITNEFSKAGINDFHLSQNRIQEYESVLALNFTKDSN